MVVLHPALPADIVLVCVEDAEYDPDTVLVETKSSEQSPPPPLAPPLSVKVMVSVV